MLHKRHFSAGFFGVGIAGAHLVGFLGGRQALYEVGFSEAVLGSVREAGLEALAAGLPVSGSARAAASGAASAETLPINSSSSRISAASSFNCAKLGKSALSPTASSSISWICSRKADTPSCQ
jgi:hypothetical protein